MIRFELEISRANKPRRLFLNRVYQYDDMFGCMARGFMARVGWLFVQTRWKSQAAVPWYRNRSR